MNALSQGLRDEIDAALEEARQDPDIRAVVITGAGRAFSAGADIGGGGGGGEIEWPYGIPEGMSLTEHYGDWRDRDRSNIESQLYRVGVPQAYHRRDQRVVPGRRIMAGPHLPHDHRRR